MSRGLGHAFPAVRRAAAEALEFEPGPFNLAYLTSKAAGVAIEATPKAPLAPGAYLVKWHVLSADGHKSEGVFNFSVR